MDQYPQQNPNPFPPQSPLQPSTSLQINRCTLSQEFQSHRAYIHRWHLFLVNNPISLLSRQLKAGMVCG